MLHGPNSSCCSVLHIALAFANRTSCAKCESHAIRTNKHRLNSSHDSHCRTRKVKQEGISGQHVCLCRNTRETVLWFSALHMKTKLSYLEPKPDSNSPPCYLIKRQISHISCIKYQILVISLTGRGMLLSARIHGHHTKQPVRRHTLCVFFFFSL